MSNDPFRTALPYDVDAIKDGYERLTADLIRLEAAQANGAPLATVKADLDAIYTHAQRVTMVANVTAKKISDHLARHVGKVA